MNHTRGLMSTAQALRQTFLTPLKSSRFGLLQQSSLQNGRQLRFFQNSPSLALKVARAPVKGPIKDEEIRARTVQVVNSEGDLEPPEFLSDVLTTFDRTKYFLIQVSPGAFKKPPVCKVMNKLEYRNAEKAKEKAAKAAKQTFKQIELNWAIDAHDLEHRLKQLATFLEKGRKVEIVLTRKKHKRPPTVDEIKHVMQTVLDTTREAGGTQVKAMEGEPGKRVMLTVKKADN
ncbi:hypothetical protein N7466_011157 [Penicillium verhagenii]|uniref:uncharacterized protein n=1 Tax=Penicillium verhagenii TaxID=1562060 RepID=UPI002544DE7E|nr:uncharacterized protein N7466_011157 [Penicillium verhagenii]KAJ5917603.1 hypothetical protein N7466_011157 [Penicillium verhagenii]